MKLSNFTKTGAAFVLALGMAAPLALTTSPASAEPHDNMMGGMHMDAMHDHGHRPPASIAGALEIGLGRAIIGVGAQASGSSSDPFARMINPAE